MYMVVAGDVSLLSRIRLCNINITFLHAYPSNLEAAFCCYYFERISSVTFYSIKYYNTYEDVVMANTV